jgi:hypothetical protein
MCIERQGAARATHQKRLHVVPGGTSVVSERPEPATGEGTWDDVVSVEGSDAFKRHLADDLAIIRRTASGGRMLAAMTDAMSRHGHRGRIVPNLEGRPFFKANDFAVRYCTFTPFDAQSYWAAIDRGETPSSVGEQHLCYVDSSMRTGEPFRASQCWGACPAVNARPYGVFGGRTRETPPGTSWGIHYNPTFFATYRVGSADVVMKPWMFLAHELVHAMHTVTGSNMNVFSPPAEEARTMRAADPRTPTEHRILLEGGVPEGQIRRSQDTRIVATYMAMNGRWYALPFPETRPMPAGPADDEWANGTALTTEQIGQLPERLGDRVDR